MTRCGYVALMGRPNAGKSSLLNSLIKAKIAGVSAKPQTTRNKVLGIYSDEDVQLLFLDTPGLHQTSRKLRLNQLMNAEAWSSLQDADVVLYLVDCGAKWHEEDSALLAKILREARGPVHLVASKADRLKKHELAERLAGLEEKRRELAQTAGGERLMDQYLAVSAKRPEEVDALRARLAAAMPEGAFLFPADELTDRPKEFVIAEMIREKVFRHVGDELPYQIGVRVESYEDKGKIIVIHAAVVVARDSQKPIIIGKQGQLIRKVGSEARVQIEDLLQNKVFLDLVVKVDEDWMNRDDKIAAITDLEP